MSQNTDILIVGGGLNGATMALACASIGLSVQLIDRRSKSALNAKDFDGRSYALAHSSVRMLKALGIWDAIKETTQPIFDIKVSDGIAGQGASRMHLHFDHTDLEEGPMGFMCEDRFLRVALMKLLDQEPLINVAYDTDLVDWVVEDTSVTAVSSAKDTFKARMMIGADGRGSSIAARAGLVSKGWAYDQIALVCALEHEKPHQGCAHQFFTPAGPLAILPLKENRSSIVWTERRARALEIADLDDEGYLEALRPVFGSFLGEINLVGQRYSYPLSLEVASAFVSNRIAMIGDAVHRVHPLAGQGLNLGLRDIAALAETLALAHRRGEDIGRLDVLERYQAWRRFDTQLMALATDQINRLFSNDNTLLRGSRDIGLGAVNSIRPLKRKIMRQAAGLGGDLPKLLQGQLI